MAKSDKHKKRRKQEKAKTQLTGVKKLLTKPQNLFEPTLRAKKIVIREQLKSQDITDTSNVEITTRKKQNIKEILSALNHHNTNIKKDALSGLQEIVSNQTTDTLVSNLDRILARIAALTSDLEDSVRKENLRVAEIIFAAISEDQVQPFWNLLLTHVQCSLTNLNIAIRYSCLSFLSLLVSYFPNLVCKSSHIILPNIMKLVAAAPTPATGTSHNKSTKDDKSHLKIDIDTRERIRVLSLITSCLDLETTKQNGAFTTIANTHQNRIWGSSLDGNGGAAVDASRDGLYYPHGYFEYCSSNSSEVNMQILSDSMPEDGRDTSRSDNFWPNFVQSYLPLLCETWMESRPAEKGNGMRGNSSLPKASVDVLECVVKVMVQLIVRPNTTHSERVHSEEQLNLIKILRKNESQKLKKYFFESLPFSAVHDSQRKRILLINLNLFLCAAQLRLMDEDLLSRFETYLNSFMKKSNLDPQHLSIMLDVLCLLRVPRVKDFSNKTIIFALEAGYLEDITSFLLNSLTAGNEASETINTIDWNVVIPKLIEAAPTVNNALLKILIIVGLRNLADLKVELQKASTFEKFKGYIENDLSESRYKWDQVIRLFQVCESLELIFTIGLLDVPEEITQFVNLLRQLS